MDEQLLKQRLSGLRVAVDGTWRYCGLRFQRAIHPPIGGGHHDANGAAMTRGQLLRWIRYHYAVSAIGPSTSRRMIRKGDIEQIRTFLDRLDLRRFNNPTKFRHALDRSTRSLAKLLPKDRWGAARKFLNIYLRNATYNFYLRRAFRLDRVEHLLELPMDSYTAQRLSKLSKRKLPAWKGVIHLTPEANAAYQAFASKIASAKSIHRVHLDMRYWRAKR